jgi:crotonobetainyl-CoA:carnitine CoA-transferase CaiB-like acyl-CoA transferase
VALDLKDPSDREPFLQLSGGADVVIQRSRPGVMDALGLSDYLLATMNPSAGSRRRHWNASRRLCRRVQGEI